MKIKRIAVIVLDGVGAGELPDADQYGDKGSNTLSNIAHVLSGLNLPNMGEIGLGNITRIEGVPPRKETRGAYGKCAEVSKGKDSVTGHWELMGIEVKKPFPTYPNGFPKKIIDEFKDLGKERTLEALKVAYCESKWEEWVIHINNNGSWDGGVFQLNSIHNLPTEKVFNAEDNIKEARRIVEAQGWRAWVCQP